MKELQRVTATLVFRSNTNCAPYKVSSIFSVLSYDMPLSRIRQQLEVKKLQFHGDPWFIAES
jgi:hypothetical protein